MIKKHVIYSIVLIYVSITSVSLLPLSVTQINQYKNKAITELQKDSPDYTVVSDAIAILRRDKHTRTANELDIAYAQSLLAQGDPSFIPKIEEIIAQLKKYKADPKIIASLEDQLDKTRAISPPSSLPTFPTPTKPSSTTSESTSPTDTSSTKTPADTAPASSDIPIPADEKPRTPDSFERLSLDEQVADLKSQERRFKTRIDRLTAYFEKNFLPQEELDVLLAIMHFISTEQLTINNAITVLQGRIEVPLLHANEYDTYAPNNTLWQDRQTANTTFIRLPYLREKVLTSAGTKKRYELMPYNSIIILLEAYLQPLDETRNTEDPLDIVSSYYKKQIELLSATLKRAISYETHSKSLFEHFNKVIARYEMDATARQTIIKILQYGEDGLLSLPTIRKLLKDQTLSVRAQLPQDQLIQLFNGPISTDDDMLTQLLSYKKPTPITDASGVVLLEFGDIIYRNNDSGSMIIKTKGFTDINLAEEPYVSIYQFIASVAPEKDDTQPVAPETQASRQDICKLLKDYIVNAKVVLLDENRTQLTYSAFPDRIKELAMALQKHPLTVAQRTTLLTLITHTQNNDFSIEVAQNLIRSKQLWLTTEFAKQTYNSMTQTTLTTDGIEYRKALFARDGLYIQVLSLNDMNIESKDMPLRLLIDLLDQTLASEKKGDAEQKNNRLQDILDTLEGATPQTASNETPTQSSTPSDAASLPAPATPIDPSSIKLPTQTKDVLDKFRETTLSLTNKEKIPTLLSAYIVAPDTATIQRIQDEKLWDQLSAESQSKYFNAVIEHIDEDIERNTKDEFSIPEKELYAPLVSHWFAPTSIMQALHIIERYAAIKGKKIEISMQRVLATVVDTFIKKFTENALRISQLTIRKSIVPSITFDEKRRRILEKITQLKNEVQKLTDEYPSTAETINIITAIKKVLNEITTLLREKTIFDTSPLGEGALAIASPSSSEDGLTRESLALIGDAYTLEQQ